tara:strand:+ start:1081 stop:1944 length:864 start_codon:yes stop_codon:yes gene_type:complete
MYLESIEKQLKEMINLKKENDYKNYNTQELGGLITYNGIWEFKFRDNIIKMLNIFNDDLVALKYFWKERYEQLSLNLWYEFTRDINSVFFDVGAHTGIYSIVGNLNKSVANIVSLEPYYLNYSRMLDNLKLNKMSMKNAFMFAASNSDGTTKFKTVTNIGFHTSGGLIAQDGNHHVNKIKLDSVEIQGIKVGCIKIDTEGHEYEVLHGGEKLIKAYSPDIIFEINLSSAKKSIEFLTDNKYEFFLIDDDKNKLIPMKGINSIKLKEEGINCLATKSTDREIVKKYIK